MHSYAWSLLALPLAGFVINGAAGRRFTKVGVAWVGCGSVGAAFLVSLYAYLQLLTYTPLEMTTKGAISYYTWVTSGRLSIDFGMLIDPLTAVMLLIVTGVGFLIHVYSVGYMHDDRDFSRFFAYMNLFIFSMVMLVVANNFLFLLIGWGLVGLSSYLLIGFWYSNMSAVLAARKALVMNVIGDVGIMLAIFLMIRQYGTISYAGVFAKASTYHSGDHVITALCLLLLVGAIAKSAQLPLHTWLPDAMEGPTPVSALIHAATMVTAGVYLIARCHVLYDLSPVAAGIVTGIGATTALVAATIALVQTDIKRVLAYSTMSQIGYMFLGVGAGAYASGMFHMMTHAFFKALLFMGAGSVIHALGGEQDLRKMGGLSRRLPGTYILFTLGVIAIAGIPPFAGFWSKDEILAHAWAWSDWHVIPWAMGVLTAGLTVFYMFRLWYLAFHGTSRVEKRLLDHTHEAPATMMMPMIVLGALSVVGGFIQLPSFGKFHEWLDPVFGVFSRGKDGVLYFAPDPRNAELSFQWGAFVILLGLIAIGYLVARSMYARGPRTSLSRALVPVHTFLAEKWYFDRLYELMFERPGYWLAMVSWRWLDRGIIDGLVNSVGHGVRDMSNDIRPAESGYVRTYALSIVVGAVLVVLLAVGQR
jgi:NADH-quinone oxidoreductase subunit L